MRSTREWCDFFPKLPLSWGFAVSGFRGLRFGGFQFGVYSRKRPFSVEEQFGAPY